MSRLPITNLAVACVLVGLGLCASCLEPEGETSGGPGAGGEGSGGYNRYEPNCCILGSPTATNPADLGTCEQAYPLTADCLSRDLTPEQAGVPGLLNAMTVNEKIDMLNGGETCPDYSCDFDSTGVPSLGIPDWPFRDGPRGAKPLYGFQTTTWAVAESRAATFDQDMEYRVGQAHGREMRAFKCSVSLAPTINTLRHPGWARAQETYGEDPVVLGRMGAAFVRGLQELAIACPKHFAGNNTDENRHVVIAEMDEQTLRENYTLAFKIVVEQADPGSMMVAYNGINGEYCTENHHLLTDIARTAWGWTGMMISDWWATRTNGVLSLNAGLDLEMPDKSAFEDLPQALAQGDVTGARIDEAAERILNVRTRFTQLTEEYLRTDLDEGIVHRQDHIDLARETSEKGQVLLKNDGILPLNATSAARIMLMGPDANAERLGDRGSSDNEYWRYVSVQAGLEARIEPTQTIFHSDNPADAANADVVIIPVAMTHYDEGEAYGGGGDRDDLTIGGIHPFHWNRPDPNPGVNIETPIGITPSDLVNQTADVNPNVIVLLNVGSAIVMEDWYDSAAAIVQTWYPGQEGGHATASLLFGDINYSGKLPFTVARDQDDYPVFGNHEAETSFAYLHGYRKFEAEGLDPRFWFGFGLSYTTYTYSDPNVLCPTVTQAGQLNVEVTVTNSGQMAGEEVVFAFTGNYPAGPRRPVKELKAFARTPLLAPGESAVVRFGIPARDMAYWDETANDWVIQTGEHTVFIGPSADPTVLKSATFTIS